MQVSWKAQANDVNCYDMRMRNVFWRRADHFGSYWESTSPVAPPWTKLYNVGDLFVWGHL